MGKLSENRGTPVKIFLQRLLSRLPARRKWQLGGLFILMLVGGFAEILSLGMVVPFLMAASNPDQFFVHAEMRKIADLFQVGERRPVQESAHLVLLLALTFASAVILSTAIRSTLLWASVEFASRAGTDLSCEVYRRKLFQPYQVHTASNSSALIAALVGKIPMIVTTLSSFLLLATSLILCVFIFSALLFVHAQLAFLSAATLGLAYFGVAWANRRKIAQTSKVQSLEQARVVKALQEGLGGIRDVILDHSQLFYCGLYRSSETGLRRARAKAALLSAMPKVWVEAVTLLFFAGLVGFLGFREGALLAALPGLGALALGAQRLLPAIQQGYSSWTYIRSAQNSVLDVLDMLELPVDSAISAEAPSALTFQRSIRFDNVRFRYSPLGPWIFEGLSFVIAKGGRVGFVGRTGSGKSTCLDLLMGLLEPTEGHVLVDERVVSRGTLGAWRRNIANVPQSIFLVDGSFAENIALGIAADEIDHRQVKNAARQAQIAEFIESSPKGYHTEVGERGIRLSGGQRQRIGIARALYKQAQVLVLDEATSALDTETEKAVMDSIELLSSDLTILIIAHRISTLKKCTQIIDFDLIKAKTGKTKARELG